MYNPNTKLRKNINRNATLIRRSVKSGNLARDFDSLWTILPKHHPDISSPSFDLYQHVSLRNSYQSSTHHPDTRVRRPLRPQIRPPYAPSTP